MSQRRAKPPHHDPVSALKAFKAQHPELGFHKRTQRNLTRFLLFWAVEIHGLEAVDKALLTQFFSALDLPAPTNPSDVLARLKSEKELIKTSDGYRPSAHLKESLQKELENKPPLLKAEPQIEALLKKVIRSDAKNFLEEAHLCLRANAARAAIVMTWIVVMDHLYEYVLAHKLSDFNVELAKKNWKITSITAKDDFAEIRKEKDFIEICRAANVFNNDVRKILDEKLGIRNTAGHPSTVTVHGTKAANFIEDLVENVVLKFTI
jgi:hypothetical protein